MRVTLRPTYAEDIASIIGGPPGSRVKCITALADGKIVGIGGLVYPPDGTVWASALILDEARRYKAAIYRTGREVLELAKRSGHRRVYAKAEANRPGAAAFLARLGFVQIGRTDVWVWQQQD